MNPLLSRVPTPGYSPPSAKPLLAGELKRQHIQEFIADQLARWKPATDHNRYRGLHASLWWQRATERNPSG
jgi:hypothetical protein